VSESAGEACGAVAVQSRWGAVAVVPGGLKGRGAVALSEAKRVATELLSERSEDMLRSDRERAEGFRA